MKYFNVHPCCLPVKGASRSVICDLQRDSYLAIPNALYDLLEEQSMNIDVEGIAQIYDPEDVETILEYFYYLREHEYGYFSENLEENIRPIDTTQYFEPKTITNAILDFDEDFTWIEAAIEQLSSLRCEAVEIRISREISLQKLHELLGKFQGSPIRSVEMIIPFNSEINIKRLTTLRLEHSRLRKIIVHSTKIDRFYDHLEFYVYFTKQKINIETCCGVVSPYYFVSKLDAFIEAKKFNSCLNKKISIDSKGNIKNCPSMTTSYGKIQSLTLNEVLLKKEFTDMWKISKDQVTVCQDCEFRYICPDCRAFRQDDHNVYSKPLKCSYDPYTNEWKSEKKAFVKG